MHQFFTPLWEIPVFTTADLRQIVSGNYIIVFATRPLNRKIKYFSFLFSLFYFLYIPSKTGKLAATQTTFTRVSDSRKFLGAIKFTIVSPSPKEKKRRRRFIGVEDGRCLADRAVYIPCVTRAPRSVSIHRSAETTVRGDLPACVCTKWQRGQFYVCSDIKSVDWKYGLLQNPLSSKAEK